MIGARAQMRLAPYWLLAPFTAVFALFIAYPLVQSVVLATHTTFGPDATVFVGLDNFRFLIADPQFWVALRNTVIFTLGSVFIQLPLSLGLAMLLNRPDIRAKGAFRLIFFSPVLVGFVFVAMLFRLIFEKQTGLLNLSLHAATDGWWSLDFPWLQNYIMLALIIAALWMYVGFNMVYFLAALQNVRKDLQEAALVDGAGPWHRFRHVTLPAIRPVATFVVLLSVIGSFQLFELPWIMLPDPPASYENRALTIVMYLYHTGFEVGDLGYASAIGWAMAVLLLGAAGVQLYLSRADEGVS